MFSATQSLIAVATAYCEATGKSLQTLSRELLGGGSRLQAIADGGDLNTKNYEAAMRRLSVDWPEGAVWPASVPRPVSNLSSVPNTTHSVAAEDAGEASHG